MGLQQGFTTGGMGSNRHFAWHQFRGADVRFGLKADIAALQIDVRFTPKSGHRSARRQCPLCAKMRHEQVMPRLTASYRRIKIEALASDEFCRMICKYTQL